MQRIEVDVQTGEQKIIDLTEEEIAEAQAQAAAWEAEQAAIALASQPTKEELMAKLLEIQAQLESM